MEFGIDPHKRLLRIPYWPFRNHLIQVRTAVAEVVVVFGFAEVYAGEEYAGLFVSFVHDVAVGVGDEAGAGMCEGNEALVLVGTGAHPPGVGFVVHAVGGIQDEPRSFEAECARCFGPAAVGADHDAYGPPRGGPHG